MKLEKVHGCVQIASLRSSGYGFLEDSKEAWEASRELVLGKWGRHEVGVENLVTANKISHCDDYLIIHGCVQIASLRSSGYGFLEDSKEAWEASRELVLGKWALDVLRHEVGVENLVTANKISHCDEYLISD
ncbi:hypothetical protein Lser_V15G28836 [Lactuca serriola]